jgi:hypothetical protein
MVENNAKAAINSIRSNFIFDSFSDDDSVGAKNRHCDQTIEQNCENATQVIIWLETTILAGAG